jgi:hypothetical protein
LGAMKPEQATHLHVGLDLRVIELSADETLGVEDRVVRVHRNLVLGSISDETLRVGEGDVGRGGAVSLVVGDDLDTVVLPDSDAGVGGSEVNSWRKKEDEGERKRYVSLTVYGAAQEGYPALARSPPHQKT